MGLLKVKKGHRNCLLKYRNLLFKVSNQMLSGESKNSYFYFAQNVMDLATPFGIFDNIRFLVRKAGQ